MASSSPARARRLRSAVLATLLVVTSACGVSGRDDGLPDTGTGTGQEKRPDTTDADLDDLIAQGGVPTDPDDLPDLADLEAVLPTVAELPKGFRDVTDEEDDDEDEDETDDDQQQLWLDACPGFASLAERFGSFTDEGDEDEPPLTRRAFEDGDGRTVEVEISDAEGMPPAFMDLVHEAFDGCRPITVEDENGVATFTFAAVEKIGTGEGGIHITFDVDITAEDETGQPWDLEATTHMVLVLRSPLMVQVNAASGLRPGFRGGEFILEAVDIDPRLAVELAESLDAALVPLVD